MDVETAVQYPACLAAVTDAEKAQLKTAISNPSFEFWYVLHYLETTREFADAADAARFLSTYIKGYSKNSDVFDDLNSNTSIAISRSRHLLANHPRQGPRFPNPSTGVHELVARLLEIASR
jgi:hypothetical protein